AIHVPARVYPLAFAPDKYLGHTAALLVPLAPSFQLIRVVGVHYSRIAIHLNFRLWEIKFDELAASPGELGGAIKNRFAISPGVSPCLHGYRLLWHQFFEHRPVVREIGPPDCFSYLEQLLLCLLRERSRHLLLLSDGFRVQLGIAAGLDPLAILLRVE